MSWMTQLANTYDNLKTQPDLLRECKMPLVPPSHTVQNSHVEIILRENSEIAEINQIDIRNRLTIVPCTDDSASRSSGVAPNMLYDNLKYIAADAYTFGNDKLKKNYEAYCNNLKQWCESELCPNDVKVIYKYISKGTIIDDLISRKILILENDKLKWNGEGDNKPADALSTFVRFKVEHDDGTTVDCNANSEIFEAYSKYDAGKHKEIKLCYVTGEKSLISYKHHAKIRNAGDSAKLISANDSTNFTYRGRFNNAEDAFSVGYEISQKAHSALRWLVSNQGFTVGGQTTVVWATDSIKTLNPQADTEDIFGDEVQEETVYSSLKNYSDRIKLLIHGYFVGVNQEGIDDINTEIMIVEAATLGRLSIAYYREMSRSDYLNNIKKWHTECVWKHSYKFNRSEGDEEGNIKNTDQHIQFVGAPSINDIVFASYGAFVDEKLKQHLVEVLVSCVVEGRRLPEDVMQKSVQRVSNPMTMGDWELQKSTSIACALIRKYYLDYKKEEYDMAIDYNNMDRSYLFGRVLAYAERIENYSLYLMHEKRVPNALKLRNKYRMQPANTLVILDDKLQPYVDKLYTSSNWLYTNMQEIISMINERDFMNNTQLSPLFLLGYACQTMELQKKNEMGKIQETELTEN